MRCVVNRDLQHGSGTKILLLTGAGTGAGTNVVMLVPVFFLSKIKLHSDSDIYYLFYDQISQEAARFSDNLDKISSLVQFLISRSRVEALQQLIYFFHYMMNSKYS